MKSKFEHQYCFETGAKKKIKWHPILGTVHLSIQFLVNAKWTPVNFIVDTCMANFILFLKKRKGCTTAEDFRKNTCHTEEQVKKPIQKMLNHGLLVKDSQNQLKLNENFSETLPKGYKMEEYIDLIHEEIDHSGEMEEFEELRADRNLMVQAMIVKIMKASKEAKVEDVMTKVRPMIEAKGFKFNS